MTSEQKAKRMYKQFGMITDGRPIIELREKQSRSDEQIEGQLSLMI